RSCWSRRPSDPRERPRQALRSEAHTARPRLRARAGRLPPRHGPERVGEDDAPAPLRRARGAHLGGARGADRPRPARIRRPRAARLPRADGAREPRPLRAALPRAGTARADRDAARAIPPLGRSVGTDGLVLARDVAAPRAVPRVSARARALRPR